MKTENLFFGVFATFAAVVTLLFFLQRMRPPVWVKTLAKVTHVNFDNDGCIVLHLDFEIASREAPGGVQLYHAQELADEPVGDQFGSDEKRLAKFASLDMVDLWYARHDPTEIHLSRPSNFLRFCGALTGAAAMVATLYFFAGTFVRELR